MCVIAALTGSLGLIWVILEVALALGAVIFVHELGHFLVAKACGVKCEKFFIGFDIGGYKISRKWGETEYGIGILPLGGYVKMLGQDDNPSGAARDAEEARQAQEKLDAQAGVRPAQESRRSALDPRDYRAKSVPQRMAIISAGVVMNIIFAFIFATVAYGLGVPYLPCIVSKVVPGSPAWEAGLRTGDEVVQIGNLSKPGFNDLRMGVSLGDLERGVRLYVDRPGDFQQQLFVIKPRQKADLPTIGLEPPWSTRLADPAAVPDTSAAQAGLQAGDRIVAADGQPINTYSELVAVLVQNPGRPIQLTVERREKEREGVAGGQAAKEGGTRLEMELAPNPLRDLGLVMKMGPITGVQADSPAAKAGLREGDFVAQLDEGNVGDPMTLPERLRQRAAQGEEVTLAITRMSNEHGEGPRDPIRIALRDPLWWETPMPGLVEGEAGDPLSAPALGIAYRVLNKVHAVEPGSPAEQAGILPGDVLVQARFLPIEGEKEKELPRWARMAIPLGDAPNWPMLMTTLQRIPFNAQVELTVKTGDETRTLTLSPRSSPTLFNPDRGLVLAPLEAIRRASSLGEAAAWGLRETKESLLMVYRVLQKLGSQVPVSKIGGPLTIAQAAGASAMQGPSTLLIFLTVLSANLAVLNFLPIPMLDGGHMVFLILEAIFRRPVSERVVVALHMLGFVFLAGLMLLVLAMDIGRLIGS